MLVMFALVEVWVRTRVTLVVVNVLTLGDQTTLPRKEGRRIRQPNVYLTDGASKVPMQRLYGQRVCETRNRSEIWSDTVISSKAGFPRSGVTALFLPN